MSIENLMDKLRRKDLIIERLKRENYKLKIEIGRLLDTIIKLKGKPEDWIKKKKPEFKIKSKSETYGNCTYCGKSIPEEMTRHYSGSYCSHDCAKKEYNKRYKELLRQ